MPDSTQDVHALVITVIFIKLTVYLIILIIIVFWTCKIYIAKTQYPKLVLLVLRQEVVIIIKHAICLIVLVIICLTCTIIRAKSRYSA